MDLSHLEKILIGEPNFRLKQAKTALFSDLVENWQEATVLPLALRKKLSEECLLKIAAETSISNDKMTIKALLWLKDGLRVETVLMRYPSGRNTICVSSEVGCPLACSFCATGKMGFKRNLEVLEIIEQVLFFARYLKKLGERVTNIVFMGMGEPFLNYDNVIRAIKILNDKDAFNIGARHISVSTVGIGGGIQKLAKEPLQINLAISLHAPNDDLRSKIVPANKAHSLAALLTAIEDYLKTTKRKVMFEYIMIGGVNDSPVLARELTDLLRRFKKLPFLVNLIAYNPTGIFKPSSRERINDFKKILEERGIEVTERYRFGRGIKAACGQLAGK